MLHCYFTSVFSVRKCLGTSSRQGLCKHGQLLGWPAPTWFSAWLRLVTTSRNLIQTSFYIIVGWTYSGKITKEKLVVTSSPRHFCERQWWLGKNTANIKMSRCAKKTQKRHILVKPYYKQHRDIISNDFNAALNLSSSFFEYWTRLNNHGFFIKQRCQQRFSNEDHLLISSAIQWKLVHHLYFSLKLSKSFLKYDWLLLYAKLFSKFFQISNALKQQWFSH